MSSGSSTPSTPVPPGGRRAVGERRRLEGTVVAALLVPLLALGALLLVDRPGAPGAAGAPAGRGGTPVQAPLSAVDLGCPSGGGDGAGVSAPRVLLAAPGARGADGAGGGAGGGTAPEGALAVDVAGGDRRAVAPDGAGTASTAVTPVRGGDAAVVVRGRGDLAPGLLALRVGSGTGRTGPAAARDGSAAVACPAPRPAQWFTGVGAGATHASVLELVNPDAGPAVADVTVLDGTGTADVPALRGVTVRGGEALRLDLAQVAPRRGELALRVVVTRGRLATSVLDRVDRLGRGGVRADWLPSQPEPATDQLLPGLVEGRGGRTLAVANPGDDEARVTVRVVTRDSTLSPVGLDTVVVEPGTVESVDLSTLLGREAAAGAVAVRLTSSAPVTATLRQAVAGDLAHAVGAVPLATAVTLLPPGAARVVLAPADAVGTVDVATWAADGTALPVLRRELDPGRAAVVRLPRRAARVAVVVDGTTRTGEAVSAAGAVVVAGRGRGRGGGTAVLPLVALVDRALVPQVGPGLP